MRYKPGDHPWRSKLQFLLNYNFCSVLHLSICGQVQYTAYKDSDGNYVSADAVDTSGEYSQEVIPDDKVS